MIKAEWSKLLHNRKMFIAIIAVLFIPVLYSGMFLWAFWDPYKQLENLPVALVNEDKGAEMDGVSFEVGDMLVEELIKSEQFKFIEIEADEAEQELLNRNYYMAIKIPENFSEHATTLLDPTPQKLTLEYIPNEGLNFLGAQIGETAIERIKAEVNTQVATTYAENLFGSITALGDGFTEAADGASQLDEGAQKILAGADDLKGYLEKLAASTVELSDGTETLAAGAKTAATGANDLAGGVASIADGSAQLADGAESAKAGATQLQQGVTGYVNGVEQLAVGQEQLTTNQASLANNLAALTQGTAGLDENIQALADGSTNVAGGMEQLATQLQAILPMLPEENQATIQASLEKLQASSQQVSGGLAQLYEGTNGLDDKIAALSDGAGQLNTAQQQVQAGITQLTGNSTQLIEGAEGLAAGNTTLAEKLQQLAEGANTASVGANDLASGLNTLVDGTTTLTGGTSLLAEKSGELADGSKTLVDGTKELADGTTTLTNKLTEAGEQVDVKPTEETYKMVGAPVQVEKTAVNPVANYGTGFTPYFMSLGLFVGALLMSIVFPLVEPAIVPKSGFKWFISKISVLAVAGLIQSAISIVIVVFALGLDVQNMGQFILTTVLTSFVYLAIVQMLVSILGDPGRFIAILVLILQLTTSAGTFPLELLPAPLQIFNAFLPMTFTVQAYKASISMTDSAFLLTNWSVLLSYLVGCLVITLGYFTLLYKKRYSKHHTQVAE